jgi:hemerythrin
MHRNIVGTEIVGQTMGIEWKDAYKIGDPEIDAQHQAWFGKINDFLSASDKESLTICEMKMYQYTRVHFKHEETLMRSIDYPGLSDHISKHNELLSHLNGLSDQIANDTLDLVKWRNFLSAWLLNHIAVTDKALAKFVASK